MSPGERRVAAFFDGKEHNPDVWRVTWSFDEQELSFSRDMPTLDEAIAVASANFRQARILALETQADGSLMLLATWRTSWEGRFFEPEKRR